MRCGDGEFGPLAFFIIITISSKTHTYVFDFRFVDFWPEAVGVMAAISLSVVACNETGKIDRRAVVERHRIVTDSVYHRSPAQVGNGNFAFGVDVTGLQTFVPFNTMSHWSWHSFLCLMV